MNMSTVWLISGSKEQISDYELERTGSEKTRTFTAGSVSSICISVAIEPV